MSGKKKLYFVKVILRQTRSSFNVLYTGRLEDIVALYVKIIMKPARSAAIATSLLLTPPPPSLFSGAKQRKEEREEGQLAHCPSTCGYTPSPSTSLPLTISDPQALSRSSCCFQHVEGLLCIRYLQRRQNEK